MYTTKHVQEIVIYTIYNYIYCHNCVMVFVCDQYYYYYESSVLTQLLILNLHNVRLYYVDLWCDTTADSISWYSYIQTGIIVIIIYTIYIQ